MLVLKRKYQNILIFTICQLILAPVCFSAGISTISSSIVWQTSLGGTGDDVGFTLEQTSDGGCVIAGYTNSRDGDFRDSHGGKDAFVAKFDSSGKIQWKKSYGGSEADIAYAVCVTNDGGFIVAGSTHSVNGDVSGNHGGNDMWVIKLDSIGNIQWQKCLGGNRDDIAVSIQQTKDQQYILAGSSNSVDGNIASSAHDGTGIIVKLDQSGVVQWKTWLGSFGDDVVFSVRQNVDESYIVAGTTNRPGDFGGFPDIGDVMVAKLASDGKVIWENEFGGTGEDIARSVRPTADGGYILAGSTETLGGKSGDLLGSNDAWVLKISSAGELQWDKFFGGWAQDFVNCVQPTSDGGYVFIGETSSFQGNSSGMHGRSDMWLVKLSSSGTIQWQKCLGGREADIGYGVLQTSDGSFILVGGASQTGGGDILPSHPGLDVWLVKVKP